MTEQENVLLYGSEKQFGIYQITERAPEHDYRFMGLDYVQKKGITVARADYDLIYTAPLTDQVVVLSGGIVAEQGSPAELYARKGLYAHMVDLQSACQNWTI